MTLLTKLVSFSKGKSTVHAKASPSPSQTPGIKWAELSQEWLPSHRDMAKPSSGLSRRPLPPHICWWTAQCCGFLLNSNPLTSQGYSEDALWARVTWEGTEANNACPDSWQKRQTCSRDLSCRDSPACGLNPGEVASQSQTARAVTILMVLCIWLPGTPLKMTESSFSTCIFHFPWDHAERTGRLR